MNEAAERLHAFLNIPLRDEAVIEYHRLIDAALAAERRATVERIRKAYWDRTKPGYREGVVIAILDEEAAR